MPVRLVVGPMGGSKSLDQMLYVRHLIAFGIEVLVLKPRQDTRDFFYIQSRSVDWKIEATPVTDIEELIQLIANTPMSHIVLDEAHFLGRRDPDGWNRVIAAIGSKTFSASAINLGWDGEILDPFHTLKQAATEVIWKYAYCSEHGRSCRASYSWKIDPDGPDVGELGKEYEVYCPSIWLEKYTERFGCKRSKPLTDSTGTNLEMAWAAHMLG